MVVGVSERLLGGRAVKIVRYLELPLDLGVGTSRKQPLTRTLGLQIAQSRSYLYTLRPKVGIFYVLGAIGEGIGR